MLTSISIKSFHSDIFFGASKLKGPPGYDSIVFHEEMLKESSHFYKIMYVERIIGGFWFNENENNTAYIYRIFIDPDYHGKGIGEKAFVFLFNNFQNIKQWSLKTPIWNTRTPNFYQKLGFEITERTEKFFFFNKKMS